MRISHLISGQSSLKIFSMGTKRKKNSFPLSCRTVTNKKQPNMFEYLTNNSQMHVSQFQYNINCIYSYLQFSFIKLSPFYVAERKPILQLISLLLNKQATHIYNTNTGVSCYLKNVIDSFYTKI